MGLSYVSSWWKCASVFSSKKDDIFNLFEDGLIRKVGSGLHTFFWKYPWLEPSLFLLVFIEFLPSLMFRMRPWARLVSVEGRLYLDLKWRL